MSNIRFITTNLGDSATLTSGGATTNLLLFSQEFDNAVWTGGATHTANSTVAPDGSTTADTISDGQLVATLAKSQSVAIDNTGIYTLSIYVPRVAGAVPYFGVTMSFTGGSIPIAACGFAWNQQLATFQVIGAGGIFQLKTANGGAPINGVIWDQLTYYINNNNSGNLTANINFMPAYSASGSGGSAGTADVTQTGNVVVWGAMLVKSDRHSGYIKTTTAAASGGDFVTTLPVTNLQREGRARVARTADAYGNKVILGTFSETVVCTALVLYAHNLSSNASFRLRCYSGASQTGGQLLDSDMTSGPWSAAASGMRYFATWALPGSMRSFRLDFYEDVSSQGAYIQIKRLLIGSYFSPAVNVALGLSLAWNDTSVQRRTQGGSLRTERRALYRSMTGSLDTLTEAERVTWLAELAKAALSNEIFVSAFPTLSSTKERDFSMLGKFTRLPAINVVQPTTYSSAFEIEEV